MTMAEKENILIEPSDDDIDNEIMKETDWLEYPLLPVRDTVVFPHIVTPLFVGRDRSIRAVEAATDEDSTIVVVTQKDPEVQDPIIEDLYTIGTEVVIGRTLRMPDGTISILGQGKQRVKIVKFVQTDPYIKVEVRPIYEPSERSLPTEALR